MSMIDQPYLTQLLRAEDFAFYGFPQPLERWQSRPAYLRLEPPRMHSLTNATFVPVDRATRRSGIVDAQGIAQSTDRRAVLAESVTPGEQCDTDVVYLGYLFGHFGHALLESLSRVWALGHFGPDVPVVFHEYTASPHRDRCPVWLLALLDAFTIPRGRVLSVMTPTQFRTIHIPDATVDLGHWISAMAGEPYRAVADRLLRGDSPAPSSQPVYLSRTHLSAHQRLIVGERALEAALHEHGVRIVYPETISIAEQISLWNSHTDFIMCEGTAAHAVLFARNPVRLHLLTEEVPGWDCFLVPSVAHAQATYVCGLSIEGRPAPAGTGRAFPRMLQAGTVSRYLEERGFLTHAGSIVRTSEWDHAFDQAWHAARQRQLEKAAKRGVT